MEWVLTRKYYNLCYLSNTKWQPLGRGCSSKGKVSFCHPIWMSTRLLTSVRQQRLDLSAKDVHWSVSMARSSVFLSHSDMVTSCRHWTKRFWKNASYSSRSRGCFMHRQPGSSTSFQNKVYFFSCLATVWVPLDINPYVGRDVHYVMYLMYNFLKELNFEHPYWFDILASGSAFFFHPGAGLSHEVVLCSDAKDQTFGQV